MPDEKLQTSEEQVDQELSPEIEKTTNESEESTPEKTSEEEKPETFLVDGEEVSSDQLREWKRGYMRTQDYTRKTQELAKIRRTLEELQQRSQQANYSDSRPLTPEQQEALRTLKELGVVFEDDIQHFRREEIDSLRKQLEDQEVEKEIVTIKERYELTPGDVEEVLRFAVNNGLPSLNLAYKAMVFDQKIEEAKQIGQEETAKNLKKRKESMIESGKAIAKTSSAKIDISKFSYDQLAEIANRELEETSE